MSLSLPRHYLRNDSVYRSFRGSGEAPFQFGCGFILGKNPGRQTTLFDRYGILLILQGRGEYEDAATKSVEVGPGDAIQRLPGVPHITPVLPPNEEWLECFIVFGAPLFHTLADLGVFDRNRPLLHPGLDLSVVARFASLMEELRKSSPENLPHLLIRAIGIVNTLMSLDRNHRREDSTTDLITEACRLLAADPGERSATEAILAPLPLSYERLRKRFREEMGVSPGSYRLTLRIDRAREFLSTTTLSIKEIARRLGYADSFDFSRQFKKHTGTSPSSFRRQR